MLFASAILILNFCQSFQVLISDADGSVQRTLLITVMATVVNAPPVFSSQHYRFNLSENAANNDEVGLITVTDDSGN